MTAPKKRRAATRRPAAKKAPHRPRLELTDDHLRQIEVLAGYGLTQAAIAAVVGISADTLTRRKQDTDAIGDAIAKGKAKAEGLIGEALFKKARTGDVGAIRWWEMTRCGRAEKQQSEVSGVDGGPLVVSITRRIVRPKAAP